MPSSHTIDLAITVAAAVFFAIVMGMCRTVGADLWAAVVIGLGSVAVLLRGTRVRTRQ